MDTSVERVLLVSTSPTVSPATGRSRRVVRVPAVPPARATGARLAGCAPPPALAPRGVDRHRLAELMEAMADRHRWACIALYQEFGGPIAATVTVELRRHHIHYVDPDELDGLVLDVCFALADCAAGWQRDGALPWHWARARVTNVVSGWIGQFADSYNPEVHAIHVPPTVQPYSGDEPSMLDVLDGLARHNPVTALVRQALNEAGSRRDQELLLAYMAQQQAGDLSPAVTLGAMFDLSPDTVRQAVSRLRRRLKQLVLRDPRYAVLEGLSLVA